MNDKEPPNLREAECCANCRYYDSYYEHCKKYPNNCFVFIGNVCDDFERDK